MRRRFTQLIAVLLGLAVVPAAALGKGVPATDLRAGATGVLSADGTTRYTTTSSPNGSTLLVKWEEATGRELARRLLPPETTIPAVASDGTGDGLSFDARRLVLMSATWTGPDRVRTIVRVVDTATLADVRTLALPGSFAFDAVAPDGSRVFLIEYTGALGDLSKYNVRALDVRSGRLEPQPITDPREPDEQMTGTPLARVASSDGRIAYTLYSRANGVPFIHALDTVAATARCLDLPPDPDGVVSPDRVGRADPPTLAISEDQSTLTVRAAGTYTASLALAGAPSGHMGVWVTVAVVVAALAGLAGWLVRRRRSSADPLPALPGS